MNFWRLDIRSMSLRRNCNVKSDREKIWELRKQLWKARGRTFYMKYVKIILLAIMEVIAELYDKKKGG